MVLTPPASLWSPLSDTDKEENCKTCYYSQHELHNFNQRKILN